MTTRKQTVDTTNSYNTTRTTNKRTLTKRERNRAEPAPVHSSRAQSDVVYSDPVFSGVTDSEAGKHDRKLASISRTIGATPREYAAAISTAAIEISRAAILAEGISKESDPNNLVIWLTHAHYEMTAINWEKSEFFNGLSRADIDPTSKKFTREMIRAVKASDKTARDIFRVQVNRVLAESHGLKMSIKAETSTKPLRLVLEQLTENKPSNTGDQSNKAIPAAEHKRALDAAAARLTKAVAKAEQAREAEISKLKTELAKTPKALTDLPSADLEKQILGAFASLDANMQDSLIVKFLSIQAERQTAEKRALSATVSQYTDGGVAAAKLTLAKLEELEKADMAKHSQRKAPNNPAMAQAMQSAKTSH
jgi:hypothetical protein